MRRRPLTPEQHARRRDQRVTLQRPHRLCLDFPNQATAIAWFKAEYPCFGPRGLILAHLEVADVCGRKGGIPLSRTFIVCTADGWPYRCDYLLRDSTYPIIVGD
jgi:hypothetical protein